MHRSSHTARVLVGLAAALVSSSASAHDDGERAPRKGGPPPADPPILDRRGPAVDQSSSGPGDEILAPPPTYQGNDVKVDEKLGARVPLETRFTNQDGAAVSLGEALRGELPTILTFNYSDCPMLCSLQLNGLVAAVPALGEPGPEEPQRGPEASRSIDQRAADGVMLRVGAQFRIVTISLEPNESLARLTKMRERYVDKLPEDQRAAARAGWTFLTGDAASVAQVAGAVGFRYTYLADRAEWAHPAALIFLSTTGAVTRYVYGIEYDAAMLRESIVKAGLAEPATAVGFMNRCYHYDPDANNHSRAGVIALRIAAAGAVALLLAGLGLMHLLRRTRRSAPAQERT